MDCSDFKNMMSMYVDGEIDAKDKTDFERHLKHCPECENELECFRLISEKLRGMEEKELPDGFHSELMSKIKRLERKRSFFNIKMFRGFGAMAAGIVIIMVVVFIGGNDLKNDGRVENIINRTLKTEEKFDLSAGVSENDSIMNDALEKKSFKAERAAGAKEELYDDADMIEELDNEKFIASVENVEISAAKKDVVKESDRIISLADEVVFLDMNSNSQGAEGAYITISVFESRKDLVIELIKDKNKKELAEDYVKNAENEKNEAFVNINIDITAY